MMSLYQRMGFLQKKIPSKTVSYITEELQINKATGVAKIRDYRACKEDKMAVGVLVNVAVTASKRF